MAKGKSTWKYNKLLTARRNYYAYAGPLIKSPVPPIDSSLGGAQNPNSNPTPSYNAVSSTGGGSFLGMDWSNPFKGVDGAAAKNALVGTAGAAIGGIGGGLLSGGMTSGAGNLLSGLSGVAAAIPGPWGAVASAGLGLAGGLTNRMFGSKMNTENIAKVETNINNLKNFQSDASDFDTLSQNWANADVGMTFSNSYIGKDGWFSNKAKRKAADLRRQIEAGNTWVQNSLVNNAENIGTTQMQNLLSNYAAFGGPLLYSKGGSIHIKPENRGKFTETKRRTGKTTEELTHSKNPLTRKRAIFAQNAKKWKHEDGGLLDLGLGPNKFRFGGNIGTLSINGGDFPMPGNFISINNGGSHEDNPFEGVPMGVDDEGTPNLVEEGETIFNDYVFSKRLNVPKAIRDKYKLRGTKGLSFADASKQLARESEERPNDPISSRGLQALMADLATAQEDIKNADMNREFANGGKLFPTGGTLKYEKGKILKGNPLYDTYKDYLTNGVIDFNKLYASDSPWMQRRNQISTLLNDRDKSKAFREWYASQLNDYNKDRAGYTPYSADDITKELFDKWSSDRKLGFGHNVMGYDGLDKFLTPRKSGKRRYLLGPDKDANGTPLDPYSSATIIENYNPDDALYNFVTKRTTSEGDTDYDDYYYILKPKGSDDNNIAEDLIDYDKLVQGNYADSLRYAPAVGFGIGALTDALGITNKPDYTNANTVLSATRGAGTYKPVKFKPVGNYLTYRPFDRDYYINKMNAEAGATRRAISNTSGGNRATAMAGILAADNNYLNQIGGLARQAEEYNLAQRQQVEDFNRGTNTTNSQGLLQADIANQKAMADLRDFNLKGTMAAAQMREAERMAADQARSANLSGLFQTLGDIGFEEANKRMVDNLILSGIVPGGERFGYRLKRERANGGKIKRKRGLTF